MSVEKILETLKKLGLNALEANVYVYLAKSGPKKIGEIAVGVKIPRQQLLPILRNLQKKEAIDATLERTKIFSALSLNRFLDLQVEKNINQAQSISKTKAELLSIWSNFELNGYRDQG